jgi:hypothetical protein
MSLAAVMVQFDCHVGDLILWDLCEVTETLSNEHDSTVLSEFKAQWARKGIQ